MPHLFFIRTYRVRLWRRLAYWATAGAWLCATSDDDRTRLLAASGWRCALGLHACPFGIVFASNSTLLRLPWTCCTCILCSASMSL